MSDTYQKNAYLKRLEPECYRGEAWVHWSLTMHDRRKGWLTPKFLYRFREILTHTCFRYRIGCLLYVLLPDHVHMLWNGLSDQTDQRLAMAFFRRWSNESLDRIGYRWQHQAYDRVLRDDELSTTGLQGVVEYIARNPGRAGLVNEDEFAWYPYLGCLLPGYPSLKPFTDDGWEKIDRILSKLRKDWNRP